MSVSFNYFPFLVATPVHQNWAEPDLHPTLLEKEGQLARGLLEQIDPGCELDPRVGVNVVLVEGWGQDIQQER